MTSKCFLVDDGSLAEAAFAYITSLEFGTLSSEHQQNIIQLRFSTSQLDFPTISEKALHMCRNAQLLQKWNVLHLSEADTIRTIQLCLGEKAKQECGEFCVQASDVLAHHRRLNNNAIYGGLSTADLDTAAYEQYVATNRLLDSAGLLRLLQQLAQQGGTAWPAPAGAALLVHGRPGSQLERALAAALLGDRLTELRPTDVAVDVAAGADGVGGGLAAVGRGDVQLEPVETVWHCVDVESPGAGPSASHAHVLTMLGALFRLLVNSRDELALAAACQTPGLQMSSQHFLAIRRTARDRSMPMYQTVVSHVRRAQLGGRNYQPEAGCALHACTPALAGLVGLMHKLHDQLEEESDPRRCCLRLLTTVRSCILKGCKFRPSVVERAVSEVRAVIEGVFRDYGSETDPSVTGGPTVKMVRDVCDRLSCSSPPVTDYLDVLEDAVSSPTTPGRSPATLPSIVSLFRTPLDQDEDSRDAATPSLEERLRKKGISRDETPTTSKRPGASCGRLTAVAPEPSPETVAGPTLVSARPRDAVHHAPGAGIAALRQLQRADRARQQETGLSPKASGKTAQPKRSLFNPAKTAGKKRTKTSHDSENVLPQEEAQSEKNPNSDKQKSVEKKPNIEKKPKTKKVQQVQGQRSITDFFRM